MSRTSLKAYIASIINTNGANEISGQDGQDAHFASVDQLFNLADDDITLVNGMPTIVLADVGKQLVVTGDKELSLTTYVPYTNSQIDTNISSAVSAVTGNYISQLLTKAKRTPTKSSNLFTVDSSSEGKSAYPSYPEALILQFTDAVGLPVSGATLKIDSLTTVNLKDSEGEDLQNVVEGSYWAIKDPSGNYRLQGVGGGAGHTIQDDGVDVAQRRNLNFVGATVTDDAGNDATIIEYGNANYLETDFTNQTSVTVTHNIGSYPVVQVLDDTNAVIGAFSITHNSLNDYTVTFTGNKTGKILTTSGAPLSVEEANNIVNVDSLSDFPDPVANVITLADDTIYRIFGNVDVGANRFVLGNSTLIKGTYAELDQITTSTTGVIFTGTSSNFKLSNFRVNGGASSTGFALTGTGAENALFESFTIVCGTVGTITNYSVFDIDKGNFIGITGGLTITGAMLAISCIGGAFYNSSGSGLNVAGVTADVLNIKRMYFNNSASATGITIAADGANMNANKEGLLSENTFLDGSNAIVGYSPFDIEWVATGNQLDSIITSDRLVPTGWEYSVDGETSPATIAVTTTPTRLLIDGADASSNHSYQPKSIRGQGLHIWDEATDVLTPLTVGDSYDMRIQLDFASLVSNPLNMTLKLDIGATPDGTGGAGSIIVATDTKPIKGATEPIIFSFPIFTLETFITNGGTIWLQTDTGTANVAGRSILITRTASGAS